MNILGKIWAHLRGKPIVLRAQDPETGEPVPYPVCLKIADWLSSTTNRWVVVFALNWYLSRHGYDVTPEDLQPLIDRFQTDLHWVNDGIAAIASWRAVAGRLRAKKVFQPNGPPITITPNAIRAGAMQAVEDGQVPRLVKRQYLAGVLEQKRDYKQPVAEEDPIPSNSRELKPSPQVTAGESFNAAWLGIITRRAEEIGCVPDELMFRASEHRANGGTLATLAAALPHSYAELSE